MSYAQRKGRAGSKARLNLLLPAELLERLRQRAERLEMTAPELARRLLWEGGLSKQSIINCSQIRTVDKQRARGTPLGTLSSRACKRSIRP